jgi:hypothetical protein
VCESLLGTLLNTDSKTRDHGHARDGLKKIGMRPELWLDDSVKGTELPIPFIIISKHENGLCGFLKNVKILSDYSSNVSRLISLPDLNPAPGMKSHNYRVLLTQMIAIRI